jgi:hypothetical protein
MSRDYKYNDLYRYFENLNGTKVHLTFKEIENIAGVDLPPSAYNYIAYWHTSKTHTITRAWEENGWKMKGASLGEYVDFEKSV